MKIDIYQHDIAAALAQLAESTAMDATLTWDGANNYRVQPAAKYCDLDEGHRAILTRDDLQSWCDGDMSAAAVAAAVPWVRDRIASDERSRREKQPAPGRDDGAYLPPTLGGEGGGK